MTEEERIELLKWVAEVAPKEMGAEKWHESVADGTCNSVSFSGRHYLSLESDISDASACFAMLDAIERADAETDSPHVNVVSLSGANGRYECDGDIAPGDGYIHFIDEKGATRAEAVARAFVAVFEAQKQESPPE
jgi:hypothetical protein